MKLIKPSFDIIHQPIGLDGIYKIIEIAGRICYKSSDKITEESAKPFVDMLIKRGHTAMLEHGTVYLNKALDFEKYLNNKYSKVNFYKDESLTKYPTVCQVAAITTNFRVLVENHWMDDLQFQCGPTEFHEKRICVKLICDRGIWNEFIRHRSIQKIDEDDYVSFGSIGEDEEKFSFAQESTRYCNYSKDKFGNELTFIIPCWTNIKEGNIYREDLIDDDEDRCNIVGGKASTSIECDYLRTLLECETTYIRLIKQGWTPQQARNVLPVSLKTELVMTGFVSDWNELFNLRSADNAHPQARELSIPIKEEFIEKGYIKKN